MFNKDNLEKLMKQAMQNKIADMQGKIASIEAIGKSGAGLVKITINGLYSCQSVKIDPALLNEEKEVIEGLIISAFNDAIHRLNLMQKKKICMENIFNT